MARLFFHIFLRFYGVEDDSVLMFTDFEGKLTDWQLRRSMWSSDARSDGLWIARVNLMNLRSLTFDFFVVSIQSEYRIWIFHFRRISKSISSHKKKKILRVNNLLNLNFSHISPFLTVLLQNIVALWHVGTVYETTCFLQPYLQIATQPSYRL